MTPFAGRICLGCSVRLECLTEALDRHYSDDAGIWGATTAAQRDRIRRRRSTIEKVWAETLDVIEAGDRMLLEIDEFVEEAREQSGGGGTSARGEG